MDRSLRTVCMSAAQIRTSDIVPAARRACSALLRIARSAKPCACRACSAAAARRCCLCVLDAQARFSADRSQCPDTRVDDIFGLTKMSPQTLRIWQPHIVSLVCSEHKASPAKSVEPWLAIGRRRIPARTMKLGSAIAKWKPVELTRRNVDLILSLDISTDEI